MSGIQRGNVGAKGRAYAQGQRDRPNRWMMMTMVMRSRGAGRDRSARPQYGRCPPVARGQHHDNPQSTLDTMNRPWSLHHPRRRVPYQRYHSCQHPLPHNHLRLRTSRNHSQPNIPRIAFMLATIQHPRPSSYVPEGPRIRRFLRLLKANQGMALRSLWHTLRPMTKRSSLVLPT